MPQLHELERRLLGYTRTPSFEIAMLRNRKEKGGKRGKIVDGKIIDDPPELPNLSGSIESVGSSSTSGLKRSREESGEPELDQRTPPPPPRPSSDGFLVPAPRLAVSSNILQSTVLYSWKVAYSELLIGFPHPSFLPLHF